MILKIKIFIKNLIKVLKKLEIMMILNKKFNIR